MTRIVIILCVLALFFLLIHIVRRVVPGFDAALRGRSLLLMLALVGIAILIVAGVLAFMVSGEPPGGTYVPPHLDERGQVVPGAVRRESD